MKGLGRQGGAVRFNTLQGSNHLASFVTSQVPAQLAGPALRLERVTPSDMTACGQAIAVFRKRA